MIYLAWQLAQAGWFDRIPAIFSGAKEGFSGGASDLLMDAIPYLVNTVCLFGTIGIAIYGFLMKALKPLGMKVLRLLDAKLEDLGIDLIEFDDEPAREVDTHELEDVLVTILSRLEDLEKEDSDEVEVK